MTVNLLVTALALIVVARALGTVQRAGRPRVVGPLLLMVVMAALTVSGFLPLTHVLFEVSTTPMLVTSLVVLTAGWSGCAIALMRPARTPGIGRPTAPAVLLGCAAFWIGLGGTLSGFESGPTPTVTDSPVYLAHLASYLVAIAACCGLVIAGIRARQRA